MPVGSKDLNSGEYFYKTAVKTWTPLKVKLDFGQKIVWLIFGLFFKGCGLLFCSRSGHTDIRNGVLNVGLKVLNLSIQMFSHFILSHAYMEKIRYIYTKSYY